MDDLTSALAHFCRGQGTQLKLWDIDFDGHCARHLVHFLTTTTTTSSDIGSTMTPKVTSLWIQNCTFQEPNEGEDEGALNILCRFFASQQQQEQENSSISLLKTVSVKKCPQLGNAGVNQLLQAFHNNRIVETLDISYNNLSDSGTGLQDLLKHNTTLQNLIVAGNPLFADRNIRHHHDESNAMRALRRGLLHNRTLASLNLSFCQLQNQDLHQLVMGDDDHDNNKNSNNKKHHGTFALTEFWLESNQFQGLQAGTTLKRLLQNTAPKLQVLSLDSNRQLGVEGGTVLATALTTATNNKNDLKLRRLFVSCCGLQEQGTDCIVAAISQNTSLIQLHISGNENNDATTATASVSSSSPYPKTTAAQQERKRLVQIYTKRNALWTRVVQPLLSPSSSSSSSSAVVAADPRSPLWAEACVTCAQHHAHHGASAVYALVSEMVGLDFFHD